MAAGEVPLNPSSDEEVMTEAMLEIMNQRLGSSIEVQRRRLERAELEELWREANEKGLIHGPDV